MEHGAWGNNFEFRIAKLGTRPKGGESEGPISNFKTRNTNHALHYMRFAATDNGLRTTDGCGEI
jgi:hypothetical protein